MKFGYEKKYAFRVVDGRLQHVLVFETFGALPKGQDGSLASTYFSVLDADPEKGTWTLRTESWFAGDEKPRVRDEACMTKAAALAAGFSETLLAFGPVLKRPDGEAVTKEDEL